MLGYNYDMKVPYASLYEYDYWRHDNSAYEYEQKPVLDKDYKAERKSIWGYVGKDKGKPPLVQEFERKTISTCEPIQEPLCASALLARIHLAPASSTIAFLAPASTGQKFKLNPLDKQEHPMLVAKDLECQPPNPDTSHEKVQIV